VRGKLKTISGLAIGALFIYWFAHKLEWRSVWLEVREADWRLLGLAVASQILTYVIRSLRWKTLLAPLARTSFKALLRATVVGFTALFLMGRAGEMIIRPAVLSIKEKIPPSATYATVIIDRILDMVMVVIFFAVNLVFFEYVSGDVDAMHLFGVIRITGVLLLGVSAAGIYGLSVFRSRRQGALSFVDGRLQWLPARISKAVMSLLTTISEGLSVFHDSRALTVTLGYTVALWILVVATHVLVIRAFGVSAAEIPVSGAVFVMGLSLLGSVIPTPGGSTGPFHKAAAASLAFLGMGHNKAASVAIILHLVIFAPATLLGFFYVIKDGLSFARLMRIGKQPLSLDIGAPRPAPAMTEVGAASFVDAKKGEAVAARG